MKLLRTEVNATNVQPAKEKHILSYGTFYTKMGLVDFILKHKI